MNDDTKETVEKKEKQPFNLKTMFYNNTFVFIFSFLCSVVIWFSMAANNELDRPKRFTDIPIDIQFSELAQEQGIKVFSQSADTADLSIVGSTVALNAINVDNLSVVANISPIEQKLAGNTMVTETVELFAQKGINDLQDYEIVSVDPGEITVSYDRYSEQTYKIENNLKYSSPENIYISPATFSHSEVLISGPQSSVNKIARVSVEEELSGSVTQSQEFTTEIVLYDSSNKKLDAEDLYLELSVEEVDVVLSALSRKTVTLELNTINMPEGFGDSRIVIEPATIDIAADADTVSQYSTLVLETAIDFTNVNATSNTFEIPIPMPNSVVNISEETTASVLINLNGFVQSSELVESSNIRLINVPEDKEVTLVERNLLVEVIGPTAQINALQANSLFATVDMANQTDVNGSIKVPVSIGISDVTSSWIYGTNSILVNVSDKEVSSSTAP